MKLFFFYRKKNFKFILKVNFVFFLLLVFSLSSFICSAKFDILKVDIEVDKNPIDCGDEATVTVTLHMRRGDDIPSYGDLRVGLIEDDGPNATILDIDSIWNFLFTEGPNPIYYKVKCQIKEAGCQLWGPNGNSDESGAWIFAYIYSVGKKSPKIYVQCKQIDVDGELSMNGSDTSTIGDTIDVIMSAVEPINEVWTAEWGIEYDSSIFQINTVDLINPILFDSFYKGFLTYEDKPEENRIDFSLSTYLFPVVLEGPLVQVELLAMNETQNSWQETFVRCSEDSIFLTEQDEQLDVCKGGNHSIYILPYDITPPEINFSKIDFSQGLITGKSGAITDEELDYLDEYLIVSVYNEDNELVAEETVNPDGSFELGPYFWLSSSAESVLNVTNGASLSSNYAFTPPQSSIPYVYALNDTTAEPFENITIEFFIQGRSDNQETYEFTIYDTQNWEYEQENFQITLNSMEEKIMKINTSIPKNAVNGSTNTIYLDMQSTSNPDYIYSDSLKVNVFGEYIEPGKGSDKKDGSPGFEILSILISIALILLWKKKKINS